MRLIDADKTYEVLTECYRHRTDIQHESLKEALERVPTVGAVPVEEFEELCRYVRECTGDDIVCGFCEYDAGTVGEEPIECPGFESNECFVLKESLRKKYEMYDQVIRCKDCRYYDASAKSMATFCTRKQGCRETISEGFCGWAVPKMHEVEHETD